MEFNHRFVDDKVVKKIDMKGHKVVISQTSCICGSFLVYRKLQDSSRKYWCPDCKKGYGFFGGRR